MRSRKRSSVPTHDANEAIFESERAQATAVERTEFLGGAPTHGLDELATEEPLELRVRGVPVAVIMRTPGHDLELARGFALTERIAPSPRAIHAVRHCDRLEHPDAEDNIVQLSLDAGLRLDLAKLRRRLYVSSSCGVCGKATIDDAMACAGPLADGVRIPIGVVTSLPERLLDAQLVFARTGGLHAAGLFDPTGEVRVVREDVGRHNAVDKVVGWAAQAVTWPLAGQVLGVSGRISFEIVQKALAVRIPVIVAVSAPTSLAVALAQRSNITLVGFVRGSRACVYSAPERILGAQA